jgi:hypothetical protein
MELKESSLKSLLDSTEDYIKTSYELFKLRLVDKGADKVAVLISRAVAVFVFFMFILMVSVAVSLWLGSLLGSSFYGFLIVAGFYGLLGVILYFITHNAFKKMIANSIIKQAFKE